MHVLYSKTLTIKHNHNNFKILYTKRHYPTRTRITEQWPDRRLCILLEAELTNVQRLHTTLLTFLVSDETYRVMRKWPFLGLMSHFLKLFLKVTYELCEEQLSPTQFGFKNEFGTLFSIHVILKRRTEVRCL